MKTLHRLEITAENGDDYGPICGALALRAAFGWEEEPLPSGGTRFRIHCERGDVLIGIREAVAALAPGARADLAVVEEKDWVEAWKEFFTPVIRGRFAVIPPWSANLPEVAGRTPVIIEPKSAFGTGHHASTALCLGAIDGLLESGRIGAGATFLDLGTGSGVLGIACARSGLVGMGLDIDPLAADNALENRAINGIPAGNFEIATAGVEGAAGRTFDIVIANILAGPLADMAPDMAKLLKPGGCLVLSGILDRQGDAVEAAWTALGAPAARRVADGEWVALVWEDMPAGLG